MSISAKQGPAIQRRVIVAGVLVILLILVACSELLSWVLIFESPRTAKLFYAPPEITAETYDRYLKIRNPLLGWPATTKMGTAEYDSIGARPSQLFPGPGPGCVSTYGDSFTYGEEVENQEAWAEKLAAKLDCRIANFGVKGYGTDQALLRYRAQPWDDSPVVVLGIYQENILRIVNQYRQFLSSGDPLGFKPRFLLEDDMLSLVPMPVDGDTDLAAALRPPFAPFTHEHFLPGGNDGQAIIQFPYTISVIKALMTTRVQNGLRGIPNWLDFYQPGHPSGAFQLMEKITEQFAAEAKSRDQAFRVIIFPSTVGYQYRFDSGEDPTRALSAALERMRIPYLDLAEAIHDRIDNDNYCELLTQRYRECSGHYNPEGNSLVADIVYDWLSEKPAS